MLKLLVKKLLDFSELPVRFYTVLQTRLFENDTQTLDEYPMRSSPSEQLWKKIQRHESCVAFETERINNFCRLEHKRRRREISRPAVSSFLALSKIRRGENSCDAI